ncbi:MAG: hypothetical protein IJT77_00735 [Clostridia bacterium]|nr:hypothetical protein [Clostridia bacterium]
MKITELRKLLEKSEAPQLMKMLIETYKLVPAGRKREADIIFQNIQSGMDAKSAAEMITTPQEACDNVSSLIVRIRNGVYYESFGYKYIRDQWRYQATRGFKVLSSIKETDPLYDRSTELMHDLLMVLEEAPYRGWLKTDNAFDSMGLKGLKLYETYMKRVLKKDFSREVMLVLLDTGAGEMNYGKEFDELFLTSLVKTIRDKYRAMLSVEWTIDWMKEKRNIPSDSLDMFRKKRQLHANLYIASQMFRFDTPAKAWDVYAEHSSYENMEEALYKLLDYPSYYADTDEEYHMYWMGAYQRAVETGIVPRKELITEYNRRLKL